MAESGSRGRRTRRLGLAAFGAAAFWILLWLVSLSFEAAKASEDARYPRDWGPLPTVAAPFAGSHVDPRLTRVASELARKETEVRCWSRDDWDRLGDGIATRWSDADRPGVTGAYTSLDGERVNLSPRVCADLAHVISDGIGLVGTDWDRVSWAVNMLSHESMHARGIHQESVAECYGMQTIPTTARLLGLSGEQGRYLAERYWGRWYLHQEDPEYRAYECRDRGKLDLAPRSSVWP
jgi:hypothetical protein